MDSLPAIINVPVISEQWNALWEDIDPLVGEMSPRDTLIISLPISGDGPGHAQLQKMMQACQLNADRYNLLELPADKSVAWHQLRDRLQPKYVILLGIELQQLGMSVQFMPHQVSRFDGACWIPTLSIPDLEQYPDIKKHLWQYGLKPVFVDCAYD